MTELMDNDERTGCCGPGISCKLLLAGATFQCSQAQGVEVPPHVDSRLYPGAADSPRRARATSPTHFAAILIGIPESNPL